MLGRLHLWAIAGAAALALRADEPDVAAGLKQLDARDAALRAAIAKAAGSVAALRVDAGTFDDQFGPRDSVRRRHADAAALALDREGRLLTCYHAVRRAVDAASSHRVEIYMPTRRAWAKAKVLAGDPRSDLAVVQVVGPDDRPLGDPAWRPAEFADAAAAPGQAVLALGWLFGDQGADLQPSASAGIVSAVRRHGVPTEGPTEGPATPRWAELGGLLQTDCRLNMGASGGALADTRGRVVGIVMPLVARVGLETPGGFALPFNDQVRALVERLKQGREAEFAFLGIGHSGNDPVGIVRVDNVILPASVRAGLRERDVIVAVDGQRVAEWAELLFAIGTRAPGTVVRLTVERDRERLELRVPLGKQHAPGGYATVRRPAWQGLRVDHGSVLLHMNWTGRSRSGNPDDGVMVAAVASGSPADRAGVREMTMVVALDGQPVAAPDDFERRVAGKASALLTVVNDRGERRDVAVPSRAPDPQTPKGDP